MAARLDFILQGSGWASIHISAGGLSRRIDGVSYLSNALDDLLRMGLDIATDKGWTFAQFEHEPAITTLVAETGWWDQNDWVTGARVSAIGPDASSTSPISWTLINDAKRDFVLALPSRDELARMFLDTAHRVLEEHGVNGYCEAWGGRLGFPIRAMKALEAALSQPALPDHNYGS